jgi:hypothetical protein
MAKATKQVSSKTTPRKRTAKPLQARTADVKRSPNKKPDLCREIRDLLHAIPRFWAVHGEATGGVGIEDALAGTPAQQRNYRKLSAMTSRLTRLVCKLGRQKTHTRAELTTLVLATAHWWDSGFNGRFESMDSCNASGPPGMLIDALLRSLCGVDPDKLVSFWYATTPPELCARLRVTP